jgi:hypothetical protein
VHAAGWHTYWKNPGAGGLPTSIEWTLPPGFAAGEIRWPAPEITDTGGLVTYGYGGEQLLLVDIAVPATAQPGASVTLRARAEWLMCKESCVPGGAELSLTLPVAPRRPPIRSGRRGSPRRARLCRSRPTDLRRGRTGTGASSRSVSGRGTAWRRWRGMWLSSLRTVRWKRVRRSRRRPWMAS